MYIRSKTLGALAGSVAVLLAGAGTAQADWNIALNAVSTATVNGLPALPCTLNSGPGKAVDGKWSNIYTDKWCVPSGKPVLRIALPPSPSGFAWRISQIRIRHAGAAGESTALNTKAYSLAVTKLYPYYVQLGGLTVTYYGQTNRSITSVTNNSSSITTHNFNPDYCLGTDLNLRYVTALMLAVDVPTQGTNPATRIFEVEVMGSPNYIPPDLTPVC